MRRLILVLFVMLPLGCPSVARAADPPLEFRYQKFGRPGAVTQRQQLPELDLTLVTFGNGLRLNIRASRSEPSRFRLRIVFPINASHAGDYPLMPTGGMRRIFLTHLDKHTHQEIFALLQQHKLELELRVDQGTPRLLIQGPTAGLPFALQLVAAWLSAPIDRLQVGVDYVGSVLPVPRLAIYQVRSADRKFDLLPLDPPRIALWRAFRVATNDPRVGKYGVDRPAEWPEIADWIDHYMLHAPIEVGVVGDLDVEQLIATAATNLGALEKRRPITPQPPLAGPKESVRLEEVEPSITPGISMSCLLWPLADKEEPARTAAAAVVCAGLRDALVRISSGILPTPLEPKLWIYRDPVQRDLAFVVMQNQLVLANAGRITDAIFRTATKFADTGMTEADFNVVRAAVRQQRAADLADNQWWLDNVLWAAQTHPQLIAEAKAHLSAIDELQWVDANAAAKVFSPRLATAVILNGGQDSNGTTKK